MEPKDCKVFFYSEDGITYKLFLEGKEIKTHSVTIYAGNGEMVEIEPKLRFHPDTETNQEHEEDQEDHYEIAIGFIKDPKDLL